MGLGLAEYSWVSAAIRGFGHSKMWTRAGLVYKLWEPQGWDCKVAGKPRFGFSKVVCMSPVELMSHRCVFLHIS